MAGAGILIAGVVGVLTLLWWILFPSKSRQWIKKIPGPPTLPLVGNAHLFERDGYEFWQQILGYTREFDKDRIFKVMIGPQPAIILFKADTAEVVLNSTKHMSKGPEYRFLHPWLGTGLLTSTGAKWQSRRKLLTPTFHYGILQDFLQVFNEQSAIMVERLKTQSGKDKFDIFPYITLCALDIICDTAMGKTVNSQANSDSEYVKAVYKIGELVQIRQKSPWFGSDFVYNTFGAGKEFQYCLKVLHGFTEMVIKERTAEMEEHNANKASESQSDLPEREDGFQRIGKRKRLAFLDMLLNASKGDAALGFYDIREEVDTFMFEGHDTTAAAINWSTHLIGKHPDVQQKLHEELDTIFGDDRSRDVSMDDIKQLKYLECIIKEALRLYPSVPMFGRTLSEDCEIYGYKVPKDATAVVVTSALHMDPDHFADPARFDPDRWLPENAAGRHPYCYVPFSAGMRNCIGQKFAINEEKVVLSAIFRNFTAESCQTKEELKPIGELILRPMNGIIVKLKPRNEE